MEQQYQIPSQSSANYTKMLQAWLEVWKNTNQLLFVYLWFIHACKH